MGEFAGRMYRLHVGCQGQAVGEESSMQGRDLKVGWHYLFLHLRKPTLPRTGDWKGRGSDLNELHNQFRR